MVCRLLLETGRGAAWLAHLLWEQRVAGSNPVAPTKVNPLRLRSGFFCVRRSGRVRTCEQAGLTQCFQERTFRPENAKKAKQSCRHPIFYSAKCRWRDLFGRLRHERPACEIGPSASKLVGLVPFLLCSSNLRQGYGGWGKLCRTQGNRLVRRVCRQCGPKSHDFGYDRNDVNGSASRETLEQCLGFWYIG